MMPKTVKAEARTVDLCWTTGATVDRVDFWSGSRYTEELIVDEKSCDLKRLNAGAPLLDQHNGYDSLAESVLGVVERAWIDGGKGYATVRFSERENAEQVWKDVQAGIIRNVSVGYRIRKVEVIKDATKQTPDKWRVVDWEPMELSLVAMPADPGAQVRAVDPVQSIEFVASEEIEPQERQGGAEAPNYDPIPLWREWLNTCKGV